MKLSFIGFLVALLGVSSMSHARTALKPTSLNGGYACQIGVNGNGNLTITINKLFKGEGVNVRAGTNFYQHIPTGLTATNGSATWSSLNLVNELSVTRTVTGFVIVRGQNLSLNVTNAANGAQLTNCSFKYR